MLFGVDVNFLVIMFSALEYLSSPAVSSSIEEGAVICSRFDAKRSPITSLGVAQFINLYYSSVCSSLSLHWQVLETIPCSKPT